ncbi:hypothetical protein [Methanobrevibacter arboriphilus]|uniref:hypothetical protein n=1 Tax=Methanobrevibacter arboriphilus TaxID=39441 RepID=UPI000ABDEBC1|nr:hypothetical protein [Methanobrevibacter arboriphilus]
MKKSLELVKKEDSDKVSPLKSIVLLLEELNDFDESLKIINKVLRINPDEKETIYNKRITLSRLSKYEDALIKILINKL